MNQENMKNQPVTFTNWLDEKYYLKANKTKKGKTTYTITKTLSDACIDKIPDGYEVVYNNSGGFVARKKKPTLFTPEMISIMESELKKNKNIGSYRIDINGDAIIYIGEKIEIGKEFAQMFNRIMQSPRNQQAMMKLIIENGEFILYRYNFRGSFDNWWFIKNSKDLKYIVSKFFPLLGTDAFYELI